MKKVYCAKCKYYLGRNMGLNFFPNASRLSKYVEFIIDCYNPKKSFFANAKAVNKDNDCKEYKRKWWKIWVK